VGEYGLLRIYIEIYNDPENNIIIEGEGQVFPDVHIYHGSAGPADYNENERIF